jgi:hypothetical protein
MGVHIYSGSLVRFFTNDWENEIQRWARENGATYTSSGGRTQWPNATDVRHHLEWMREALRARFGQLNWNDDLDTYDTKKLHQEGRDALSIVAAHLHHADLPMPDELPEDVRTDAAYDEAGKKGMLASNGVVSRQARWGYDCIIVADPDGNEIYFPDPTDPGDSVSSANP